MRAPGVLDEVAALLDEVFRSVQVVGRRLLEVSDATARKDRPLRRADVAGTRELLLDVLDRHRGLVAGTGVILAPGLLADAPRWLEWWLAGVRPEALRVSHDPDSPDFYDYTAAEWYREPERTGERWVAGPYVDYLSTNEYMVTLTVPVRSGSTFLGVAGADLLPGRLEDRLLALLDELAEPALLVNAEGRVVASTTSSWLTGSLVAVGGPAAHRWSVHHVDGFPWRLLTG